MNINYCIGVISLCSENVEAPEGNEELQKLKQQYIEVLHDLEWRIPDVAQEEETLKGLMAKAKDDPMVDVATQATIVRVLKGVLEDKIALKEALEKRIKQLEAQYAPVKPSAPAKKRKAKHVKTIR
jgi:hypothetical protein